MNVPVEKLLTAVETAEMLHVTRQAIYVWVRQHRIPHIRIGKSVRFRQTDLDEWVRSNAQAVGE